MKPKILIVEDDSGVQLVLDRWVAKHFADSVEVLKASTAAGAISLSLQASVILLDLTLPDSDPQETMRIIPELRKKAPVIVITGYEDANPPVTSTILCDVVGKYGADSCVFKSMLLRPLPNYSDEWLMHTVQSALWRWSYNKQIANAAVAV